VQNIAQRLDEAIQRDDRQGVTVYSKALVQHYKNGQDLLDRAGISKINKSMSIRKTIHDSDSIEQIEQRIQELTRAHGLSVASTAEDKAQDATESKQGRADTIASTDSTADNVANCTLSQQEDASISQMARVDKELLPNQHKEGTICEQSTDHNTDETPSMCDEGQANTQEQLVTLHSGTSSDLCRTARSDNDLCNRTECKTPDLGSMAGGCSSASNIPADINVDFLEILNDGFPIS
jgi:hypothetical protein